eukprot:TRINITY_DN62774_c0_g1_i1.p1 TRINITY_DN62774_c0_g1~~TRINITY_DN62774_c0_g1_i1.p1  ORF type:complete len:501 (-),score=78.57 TRINITY_DN62774_c0_g1_i1:64-1386(-)
MDGASSYVDLMYQLKYRTYNSSTLQGDWNYSSTNLTSLTVENMTVGQPYEVVVCSNSTSAGAIVCSSSFYVIPINYNSTCSSVGGDANPKNCSLGASCDATFGICSTSGDCWCKGWYHGDNCSISGCYYTMEDQLNNKTCSGHGYCNSSSSNDTHASCVCDTGYYGIWCRKFDWYTSAITFDQPTTSTVIIQDSDFTVTWNNPDQSLSSGANLYIQYIATGLTTDSLSYDNWQYVGYYAYNSSRKASATISKVTDGAAIPYGTSGYVSFQVRDTYYTNLAATISAELKFPTRPPTLSPTRSPTVSPTRSPTRHPTVSPTKSPTHSPSKSPTHSPTHHPTLSPTKTPTMSPTAAPTNSPTFAPTRAPTIAPVVITTNTGSSDLLSGNNKVYVAVGSSVFVLAAVAGTVLFCQGRIKRRMQGTQQLTDVGITTGNTEIAEMH